MEALDYKLLKSEFTSNLESIGAQLYNAFLGELDDEAASAALLAAERKLDSFNECLEKCDQFFRPKFKESVEEDIELMRERISVLRDR